MTNPFNVGGTWRGERTSYEFNTHPDYNPSAFYAHDLGVVILDEPYYLPEGKEYGKLPPQDLLNTLSADYRNGEIVFEAVGYGLQNIHPLFLEADRTRYMDPTQSLFHLLGTFPSIPLIIPLLGVLV